MPSILYLSWVCMVGTVPWILYLPLDVYGGYSAIDLVKCAYRCACEYSAIEI